MAMFEVIPIIFLLSSINYGMATIGGGQYSSAADLEVLTELKEKLEKSNGEIGGDDVDNVVRMLMKAECAKFTPEKETEEGKGGGVDADELLAKCRGTMREMCQERQNVGEKGGQNGIHLKFGGHLAGKLEAILREFVGIMDGERRARMMEEMRDGARKMDTLLLDKGEGRHLKETMELDGQILVAIRHKMPINLAAFLEGMDGDNHHKNLEKGKKGERHFADGHNHGVNNHNNHAADEKAGAVHLQPSTLVAIFEAMFEKFFHGGEQSVAWHLAHGKCPSPSGRHQKPSSTLLVRRKRDGGGAYFAPFILGMLVLFFMNPALCAFAFFFLALAGMMLGCAGL